MNTDNIDCETVDDDLSTAELEDRLIAESDKDMEWLKSLMGDRFINEESSIQ